MNKYPYTDFHELNLDWLLEEYKNLDDRTKDLKNLRNYVNDRVDELVATGAITIPKRRIVLVGDSYAVVNSDFPTQRGVGWIKLVKDIFKDSDIEVYGNGLIGARFARNELGVAKYVDDFENTIRDIDNVDTITDVIVMGGYNDIKYSSVDIIDGFNYFHTIVKEYCPKAKIHVGFVAWRVALADTDHEDLDLIRVRDSYMKCARRIDTCYINNMDCIMHYLPYFHKSEIDNVHPNSLGLDAISRAVAGYIINNNVSHLIPLKAIDNVKGSTFFNFPADEVHRIYMEVDNQITTITSPNRIKINPTTGWNEGFRFNNMVLFDFNTDEAVYTAAIGGASYKVVAFEIPITCSNKTGTIPCYYQSGKITGSFNVPAFTAGGSDIYIEPFRVVINTATN